jgi:hypothetical protein
VDPDPLVHSVNKQKSVITCDGTKCALLNSRSINNKEHLIYELIADFDLDFLAITETWCDFTVCLELIKPLGILYPPTSCSQTQSIFSKNSFVQPSISG